MLVTQSYPTLSDPMDSPVHEIFQASILEWGAISFSMESSQLRDQAHVSCTAGRFFIDWATREAQTSGRTDKWSHLGLEFSWWDVLKLLIQSPHLLYVSQIFLFLLESISIIFALYISFRLSKLLACLLYAMHSFRL